MSDTAERLDAVDPVRWWLGWHPFGSVFGGIALGAVAGFLVEPWFVVVGASLGILGFVVGARYVNRTAPPIVEAFEAEAPGMALSRLDGDGGNRTTASSVEHDDSPPPPVLSHRSEQTAYAVAVDDRALSVYDSLTLDLRDRSMTAGDASFVFPYDEVTHIAYVDHRLEVETDEGTHSRRFPESLRVPVDDAEARRRAFAAEREGKNGTGNGERNTESGRNEKSEAKNGKREIDGDRDDD